MSRDRIQRLANTGDKKAKEYIAVRKGQNAMNESRLKDAMNFYKKASDRGCGYAQFMIAMDWIERKNGNFSMAIPLLLKAAEAGQIEAQAELGIHIAN
jgi:TPR repeat protein